jgi:lipoprotein-anchoring transpeptidase ErfK/SrfK
MQTLIRNISLATAIALCAARAADGQVRAPTPPRAGAQQPPAAGQRSASQPQTSATPSATQPLRKAADLIHKQDPIQISGALDTVTPDETRVVVSLAKQRAYLLRGDEVVIDTPISSGKRGHTTPSGSLSVLEKDKNHHSNIYGDYRDRAGRVVRAGVSAHIDSAPSGTHFVGAEMKWFMRLTDGGVGMHVGILPGYPASHGCVRMPSQSAELFYDRVKVGTPVEVTD